ncbi:12986_t:CDS:2 [Funneliformis caledonium]|uniref:12986_t:CDS:1 n=1 Tax=Funneliformis caledonium TaxID=1117310 RepID=A0A9N9D881_9GLOM|nr:12986_t:CDS:2 [Funneliformis caledonium]
MFCLRNDREMCTYTVNAVGANGGFSPVTFLLFCWCFDRQTPLSIIVTFIVSLIGENI